jgi:hypothetical protein
MPFKLPGFGHVGKSVEGAIRQISGSRVPNLGTKIPAQIMRNLPIVGTTLKEVAMRSLPAGTPPEIRFMLGDILRAGKGADHLEVMEPPQTEPYPRNVPDEPEHVEPEKPQGESDVETFITIIKQRNIVRSDRYLVKFPVPMGHTNYSAEAISLLCHEATLPGMTLHTRQAMFNALPEQRAHMIDFGGEAITFTFYLDGDWSAKRFFEDWMSMIVSPITRQVGFYNNYKQDVEIHNLNMGNDPSLVTKLIDAFPRAIQPIPLSYSNPDIAHLQVTMTFRKWEIVDYNTNDLDKLSAVPSAKPVLAKMGNILTPKIPTVRPINR